MPGVARLLLLTGHIKKYFSSGTTHFKISHNSCEEEKIIL